MPIQMLEVPQQFTDKLISENLSTSIEGLRLTLDHTNLYGTPVYKLLTRIHALIGSEPLRKSYPSVVRFIEEGW